jgi:phage internal scaffolding protein
MATKHIDEIIPEVFQTLFKHDTVTRSFKDSPSLTQQEFKDEVNINNIVKRAGSTGILPSGNREPLFDDFSEIHDYQNVVEIVNNANSAFEALPSSVRETFGNDVTSLLDFIDNPENQDKAVSMGLISPLEAQEASSTPAEPETSPAPETDQPSE